MSKTAFFFMPIAGTDNSPSYQLNCTTSAKISRGASVTSTRVESGKDITDNHVLHNVLVSLDGVITNIKAPSNIGDMSISQFTDDIKAMRSTTPPTRFDVTVGNEFVQNCIITTFDLEKTKQEGNEAWKISIEFKEVRTSERARLVEVKEARPKQSDDVSNQSSKSGSPTSVPEREVQGTISADAVGGIYNFLTGAPNEAPASPAVPGST